MKRIIILCSIFIYNCSNAQDKGIHFEHNTNWNKILAQAKLENKFIFIDCYTTWCGPCTWMSNKIFPLEEFGNFYNKTFINLKLQLDTTQSDDEDIKNWYATGNEISKQYNVISYPTYLFFDPNGKIVHKVVGGSYAEEFIARGKDAVNPEKQYYNLKLRFDNGTRDSGFLYNTTKIAVSADEMEFGKKVCSEYLNTQSNLFTKMNIELLRRVTTSSKDFGFRILLTNTKKVDSILGHGRTAEIVNRIILNEEVFPIVYSNSTPDWHNLQLNLTTKYPKQADELFYIAKLTYAGKNKDWAAFASNITNFMKHYEDKLASDQLNQYAWQVFLVYSNKELLKSALRWSKKSVTNQTKIDPGYMDTYANLLYKLGRTNEALAWERKAQRITIEQGGEKNWGQDVIDKMNKGEKTW